MFDTTTKEVEWKGSTYRMGPLTGEHIGDFYAIVKALKPVLNAKEGESLDFLDHLDPETLKIAHKLVLITLKEQYPKEDVNKLNTFVSQNIVVFLPTLIEVNLPNE